MSGGMDATLECLHPVPQSTPGSAGLGSGGLPDLGHIGTEGWVALPHQASSTLGSRTLEPLGGL